ncbi:MAG: lasso peptide biosynthesis B2 protein [Erythrobacter sp.]|nr:MAG: lasso peptide biosynthesis B2 protein [Erythrobacter sp.]
MKLPPALSNRLLWLEIWLSLGFARFLVKYVRFGRWRAMLGPLDDEPAPQDLPQLPPQKRKQAADLGRKIERIASRPRLFRAVCLPRAMAGRWVLGRRGIPTRVVIGSRRPGETDGYMFHAWLIAGDVVVTGASERADYLALRKSRPADLATSNGD